MAEFYVEQQGWAHWPKVLIMCRKNGRDVTRRRYVPEVETGEGMSITDELREYANTRISPNKGMLTAIADRIDAEHQKAIRELNELADASVLLPVDADGEVIHVGDMMKRGKARGHVIALMLSNYPKKWGGELHWGVQLEGEKAPTALDAFFHHYHEPTVEDVLREMLYKAHIYDKREMELLPDLIEEYTAKLRLADDKEQQ